MSGSEEQLRRWRLILGGNDADGTGFDLSREDLKMDRTLEALYDSDRTGSLGGSSPGIARWLGDIRTYFPNSVVRIMQQDALERLGLTQMLLEPEMLQEVEPDVHLVATLLSLSRVMPNKTKDTARMVVRKVVDELERRLANPLRQAVTGSLNRSVKNVRPRQNEINWDHTIRANLKHYQADYKTIIPEKRIGFGRRTASARDIILCVDQSGSMATSVVYSSIMAAVLASIRSVRTSLVVFDTAVVDLTELLEDPVEVLFGTQLGGGTDINRAVAYSQNLVRQPHDTIFVLITDLFEGGNAEQLIKRCASMVSSGIQIITLLALDDKGAPVFDQQLAGKLSTLGIPCFACTPDVFPDLMAATIERRNINQWAAERNIVVAR
ncbi:MAG TPA: VWA domain-containing protein [Pyrinomonadaceae bacterium]